MEIAPMTKRDKILLYVVLMLAFVVLFVRFLLIPGLENHQQADADLREAQDAQTSMQDAIMLAGTYAAEKNNNWGELQTANASYYSLLSSDELDTLVTSLELNHNLQPDSLTIGEPVTQSLTYYTASENAGQSAAPSAAASVFAGDDDSITADTADTTAQGNAILQQILASDLIPDYDQPGYYRSVAISFCCTGEDSDFLSMLDDMAANYPSVQLVSFSIDTRSFADTDGSALGIAADDGLFDPLTIIGGTIEMADGVIRQSFDCRYPTNTDPEKMAAAIRKVCGGAATLENVSSRVPFYIDADSPAIQTLINTYNDVTGEGKKPFTMGGGTYARHFPYAVSFGPEHTDIEIPSFAGPMHGANEGTPFEKLVEALKIYILALLRLQEIEL